jgi:hypothetical protein
MRLTRKGLAATGTLAVIALAVIGCGGSGGPDEAACKSAMKAAYATALASPSASPASEPPACKGIPAAALQKYAADIVASTTPSPQG